MRRLCIVPLVIWLGGCSLFLYDAGDIIGPTTGKNTSGINPSVRPHPAALYDNDRVLVTLSNDANFPIYYSLDLAMDDPTNGANPYTNALDFSNCQPFPLYARYSNTITKKWGDLLTFHVTNIADGSSPEHPFQIANQAHLNNVRLNRGYCFRQIGDINIVSNPSWSPIGTGPGNEFTGVYDGRQKSITGLRLSASFDYVGLFGYSTGSISNLHINNASILVNGNNVGILCGYAAGGSIYGCIVDGGGVTNIFPGATNTGGLIGGMDSGAQMETCTVNNIFVAGANATGGLAGFAGSSTSINNCTVAPLAISGNFDVGGMIGRLAGDMSGDVNYCRVVGSPALGISGVSNVGGLVGYKGSPGAISHCSNSVKVQGQQYTGGLVGNLFAGSVASCTVSASSVHGGELMTGGFCGYNKTPVNGCLVMNTVVTGVNQVGGFAGRSDSTIQESGVLSSVSVLGMNYVGGLVGALGDVAQLSTSFAQCPVTCTGDYAGGAVGWVVSDTTTINQCYATGEIIGTAPSYLGGFVGGATNANFDQCYASGKISDVAAGSGAFVGYTAGGVTYSACVCCTNISGGETTASASGPVTGITNFMAGDMVNPDYYTDLGWMENSPWVFPSSGLPYFTWQNGQHPPAFTP